MSLAREQEALVRALVDGGPVPLGFDPSRLAVAAEGLAHKRRHARAAPMRRGWLTQWWRGERPR